MPETLDIAVVGATGLVGEALVELLEERDFPVANLYLLASGESAGKSIGFCGRNIRVGKLDEFDFAKVRLAFLSVGAEAAADCAARAGEAGCSVIDLSGAALNNAAALLAQACVNGDAIQTLQLPALIAAPAAPAAEVAEVLAALRGVLELRQVNVAACLSASALGREGYRSWLGRLPSCSMRARWSHAWWIASSPSTCSRSWVASTSRAIPRWSVASRRSSQGCSPSWSMA